jgi:hypothetical protein
MATSWTLDRLRHLFFSEKENVKNDGRLGTCSMCTVGGGGPSLETSNSIAMTLFIVIGKKKKKRKNISQKADGWCYGGPGLQPNVVESRERS